MDARSKAVREQYTSELRRRQGQQGSKVHMALNPAGHLLMLVMTPAYEQERARINELAAQTQATTGQNMDPIDVNQDYTG